MKSPHSISPGLKILHSWLSQAAEISVIFFCNHIPRLVEEELFEYQTNIWYCFSSGLSKVLGGICHRFSRSPSRAVWAFAIRENRSAEWMEAKHIIYGPAEWQSTIICTWFTIAYSQPNLYFLSVFILRCRAPKPRKQSAARFRTFCPRVFGSFAGIERPFR